MCFLDAAPEPAKKGRTITVTGTLTRADWGTCTVKAGSDGSYRFYFAGDTASNPATSWSDYVDVR